MNTPNFQNTLALLDIHDFCPSANYISAQWKIFQNAIKIDTPQYVNGEDSSHNAP